MKTLGLWLCFMVLLPVLSLRATAQSGEQRTRTWNLDVQVWDANAQTLKPVTQNPQLASPACVACRNQCVNTREQCKSSACTRSGGKNRGPACDGVQNQQVFTDGLKACENQEKTCWDQCAAGACR